jgi:hypothetical protein
MNVMSPKASYIIDRLLRPTDLVATHGSWRASRQRSLFVTNALDRHGETELPLSNGVDLPTQRRIALNRPRTIGLEIRFDH